MATTTTISATSGIEATYISSAASPNSTANTTVAQEINTSEYLAQLIKDKNQLAAFPNVFIHLERLLDEGKSCFSGIDFYFKSVFTRLNQAGTIHLFNFFNLLNIPI